MESDNQDVDTSKPGWLLEVIEKAQAGKKDGEGAFIMINVIDDEQDDDE